MGEHVEEPPFSSPKDIFKIQFIIQQLNSIQYERNSSNFFRADYWKYICELSQRAINKEGASKSDLNSQNIPNTNSNINDDEISAVEQSQLNELTKANSKNLLNNSDGRAVILFHESWCSRSRDMFSFLDQVRASYNSKAHQEPISFLSLNTHTQPKQWWQTLIQGFNGGLPRIVFYKQQSPSMNFTSTSYQFDLKSKSQFIYFMNLHFFNRIPVIDSQRSISKHQSNKFSFILMMKPSVFNMNSSPLNQQHQLLTKMTELAQQNPLYTFATSSKPELLLSNLFQIEVSSIEQEKCAFVFIVRKYDRFDQFKKICEDDFSENSYFAGELVGFFNEYQKPFRMNTFNMRVWNYLREHNEYYCVTLFHRKKIFADEYLTQSFYNVTRDISNIVHGRKEDVYSYISTNELKKVIHERVIFLIVDRFESTVTRRLSALVGEDNFENTPSVFAFRFNVEGNTVERYPYKMRHTTFFIFSEMMMFLHGFLNERALESPLNVSEQLKFYRTQPLKEQISAINKQIAPLTPRFFENQFSDRYAKMIKVERVFNVVLFFAEFSKESLAYLPIFSDAKLRISAASSNESIPFEKQLNIKIIFSLFDVASNDQDLFHFQPAVRNVPEIRIFESQTSFIRAELTAASDKIVEPNSLISIELAKQLQEIISAQTNKGKQSQNDNSQTNSVREDL